MGLYTSHVPGDHERPNSSRIKGERLNQSEALYDVLIFLVAAVVVVPAFRRLRLSPILGYLAAGILIGPYGLAIIRDSESAQTLAEFGVVFLLFMIGLEISLERMRVLGRYVFGLGTLQVAITGLLIGGIAWAAGATVAAAIIIGSGLALSSTAFVLQLLTERGEQTTHFGRIAFAILLLQDLAVVPILMLVPLLRQDEGSVLVALGMATLKATVALVLVIGVGRIVVRPIYRIIAGTGSSELFVAMTLLVVLGTGWVLSLSGLTMALGALLAGLLLTETEYRHQVDADIRPFRGILLGLFFMTVGMSIDLGLVWTHLGQIVLLVISLLIGKSFLIAALCRGFGLTTSTAARVGLLLSQGGEFGFIIFGAALALGILTFETAQILLAVVTLSMASTPFMAYAGSRLSAFLEKHAKQDLAHPPSEAEHLKNHVVIAGFGRVGQTVAKALSASGISYVAVDLDHERVSKCRARGMPVFYGNATQVQVLRNVGVEHARAAVITLDQMASANQVVAALHKHVPDLSTFVRARTMEHSRRLEVAGATAVVPETVEASLQLGGIVLESLGSSTDEIMGVLGKLRDNDYAELMGIVHGKDGDGEEQK